MCFYNDYEWTASVNEEKTLKAEKPTKCDECCCTIPVGGTVHHTFQQEHEECQCLYYGKPDDPGEDGCDECTCEKPDFGETFEYNCCDECVNSCKRSRKSKARKAAALTNRCLPSAR